MLELNYRLTGNTSMGRLLAFQQKRLEIFPLPGSSKAISLFQKRAPEIFADLLPLWTENQYQAGQAIDIVAKHIPEAILVGGWALRLHLKYRGFMVPYMPQLDVDFSIDQTTYDKIRHALLQPQDEYLSLADGQFTQERIAAVQSDFRRKGEKESIIYNFHNFMRSPANYMALDILKNHQHVDLFVSKEEDTQMINLNGTGVRTATPQELYLRRFQQITGILGNQKNKGNEVIQLPRKMYQYLILTGSIVDPLRMQTLWKRRQNGSTETDWEQASLNLIKELDTGFQSGKIVLVDIYH